MLFILYTSGSQPGVRVPLGVHEKLTGNSQISKNHLKEAHFGTILIWGYASIKRLKAPDLYSS